MRPPSRGSTGWLFVCDALAEAGAEPHLAQQAAYQSGAGAGDVLSSTRPSGWTTRTSDSSTPVKFNSRSSRIRQSLGRARSRTRCPRCPGCRRRELLRRSRSRVIERLHARPSTPLGAICGRRRRGRAQTSVMADEAGARRTLPARPCTRPSSFGGGDSHPGGAAAGSGCLRRGVSAEVSVVTLREAREPRRGSPGLCRVAVG